RNTASFRVQTEDDRFVDATGTIQATVATGNGYTPDAANDSVDVTVNDNEAATPAVTIVAVSTGPVTESEPVVFAITSSTSMSSALAVNLLLSQQGDFIDGSAAGLTAVGDNFTAQATIAASSSTATLTVATTGDMTFEADGAIIAGLQTDTTYRIGSPSVASVIVEDNGAQLPLVTINNVMVEEGAPIFFEVTLSAPTGKVTSFLYTTSNGTGDGHASSDEYGGPVGSVNLHFGPSETAKTIRIGQRNDQIDEPNEIFTLRLYSTAMPQEIEFADGTAEATVTATILDNDVNSSISADSTSVNEGDPVVFTLTAGTAAGTAHSSADTPVLVNLLESRRNGRAIGILDAAASNPPLTPADPTSRVLGSEYTLEINLPAGETTVMFTIALSENMLQEMDTSFSATVQRVLDGRNYLPATAPNNSVEVQVANDDLPVVSIRAGNTTILEGNDIVYVLEVSPVQSMAFEVDMLHRRDVGNPVFPSFSVPSARDILGMGNNNGSEYRGTATIPAGQASLVVTVETSSIGNSQGATADVSIRSNAAYTIDANAGTLALVSEDLPQLSGTNSTASEGDGNMEFVLTLNKVPTFPVSVSYATSSGRLPTFPNDPSPAINAEDFIGVSGILRFDASDTVATVTVAIVDDDTPGEGDESFWLLFSDEKNVAPVQGRLGTITDDDDDKITFSIAAATTTATLPDGSMGPVDVIAIEGEQPALFVITGNSDTHTTDIMVNVDLLQTGNYLTGVATGVRASSVSATITAGQSSATLSIAIDDDDLDEPSGSITATLGASVGYRVAAEPNNSATVQVRDNDLPQVSIAPLNTPVDEGEFAAFVVSTPALQDSWLTVNISVSETGDVIRTSALPTLAVINPGASTATFNVATNDDDTDEPNSTITATITAHADYGITTASADVVVIADDEAPALPPDSAGLRIDDVSRNEATGTMNFIVSLTPASATVAMTVTVDYTTLDGTAIAGEDYTAISGTLTLIASPTTMTVMAGGTTVTVEVNPPVTASIPVVITDDAISEDTESFTVLLRNPMPSTVPFIRSSAIGIIEDTNPRLVSIVRPFGEISEGENAVFRFSVNRPAGFGLNDAITINLSAMDPGGYLTEAAPTTVTIARGDRTAALTLATIADDVIEPDSFIRLTIDSPNNINDYAIRDGQGSATVRVISGDPATGDGLATVEISPVAASVGEGAPAEFEITANLGMLMLAPDAVLNVGLMVNQQGDFIDASNTALTYISNDIYSTSVTLTASSLTATLSVATVDDDVDEANGNITATLQAGSLYTFTIPPGETTANASVGVTDDDLPGNLSLSLAGASTTEGADATLEFVLTLSRPAPTAITVDASTSDGTATIADGDYTAINARQVSFAIGETRQTITVAVLDDAVVEPVESLYLVLSDPMPTNLTVNNDQARGDIHDDEVPIISIAAATTSITEGEPAVFILTSSVTRPDSDGIIVQVDVGQVQVNAMREVLMVLDEISQTLVPLQGEYRPPGSAPRLSLRLLPNQSTVTLTVNTVDDDSDENHGIITATLVTSERGDYLTANTPDNSAVVMFRDNDLPIIDITPVADTVNEGEPALFTITATSIQTAALTVGVSVVETGGSFIDPPPPTMAVILFNESSVELPVATTSNVMADPNSIITTTLQTGTGYDLGAPISAEVVVLDGTERPVVTAGTVAPANVPEDGDAIRFSISLDKKPELIVRVSYQTSDGTASAPADYEAQIGTLVFDPGSTNFALVQTVTVPIVDDAIDETNETLSLIILSATNASVGMATAGGTIDDNDQTMVSIFAATTTVTLPDGSSSVVDVIVPEDGSPPQFALRPSIRLNTPLMVSVSLDNAPGSNFLQGTPPLLLTLTIPMNTSSHPFTFTNALDDDDIPEADGSIIITVLDSADYNLGTPASATVIVTDDDASAVTVTIAADETSVEEGDDATFTITTNTAPATGETLVVNVDTAQDGSFIDGTPPASVTIAENTTTAVLTVATDDDSNDEPDGSITASITPDAANYTLGTPATATVAVSDNDDISVSVAVVPLGIIEGESAVFSITATTPPPAALSVEVEITNGGAGYNFLHDSVFDLGTGTSITLAADATATTLTITIGASATSATFAAALHDDMLDEPDGSIYAMVLDGTGYEANSDRARLLVDDNDDPAPITGTDPTALSVATLTATDASAAEVTGGSQMAFVLTLTNPTDDAVTAFLYYRTTDDPMATNPATAGVDYTAIVGRPGRGRPLAITAAASSTTMHTVTVGILKDTDDMEPPETFRLAFIPEEGPALNKLENGLLVDTDNDDTPDVIEFVTGTITDTEVPTIAIADASVTEADNATLDFVVTLTPSSTATVTLDYATADDTPASA
ncbi:MAG: Calx-beta domain-containing protein, partial [Pseudohongiellaceae bacterium]